MNNPYRHLPPLGPLVGFEAAARLGSFVRAAEELNMTQSAISHQIRTLENHLQQPLFLRINRRVELTDGGRDLQQTARRALETVRLGVRQLEAYSKPGSVVVHMPPTLGALWFVPRLAGFRAAHPDIDPWLFTSDGDIDLTESEYDITVTLNPIQSEGIVAKEFFHERRVPLGNPDLAGQFDRAAETAPLLHDESDEDWQKWFVAAGLHRENTTTGPNFSDNALMLQAAAQGLGVCLGSPALAAGMIRDGSLVAMSDVSLRAAQPWYLVTLERNLKHAGVRALWDWMLNEAAQDAGWDASPGKKQAD